MRRPSDEEIVRTLLEAALYARRVKYGLGLDMALAARCEAVAEKLQAQVSS